MKAAVLVAIALAILAGPLQAGKIKRSQLERRLLLSPAAAESPAPDRKLGLFGGNKTGKKIAKLKAAIHDAQEEITQNAR